LGNFQKQLYPEPQIPVVVKVVAHRPDGVWGCAQDIKLSRYGVGYFYTFLHKEATYALKEYLDVRIEEGWQPKDKDPIWVTHSPGSKNKPLTQLNIWNIARNTANKIGTQKGTM